MNKTISILGCGWYGMELGKKLISQNYSVKGSTTSPEKLAILAREGIEPYLINFNDDQPSFSPDFFNSKTLVICIPPKRILSEQSYFPDKIQRIVNITQNTSIKEIIFISSTSVYGDSNCEITETDLPHPDSLSGKAILDAEHILISKSIFKTTILRFGGLIGPGRDPGKFFAGKTNIPNGLAPVNLIHLDDCIGITLAILEQCIFGCTLNGVAPDHPSKQEFYTKASVRSGFIKPIFINELKNWKLVSTRYIPQKLNYTYKISNWESWLNQ